MTPIEIDDTFTDLTPPGEDNNTERRITNMGYSNKAKAAEANEDQKKDLFTIDQVEVTRAAEISDGLVNKIRYEHSLKEALTKLGGI